MHGTLTSAQVRRLKAASQRLKPTFKVGKAGLSAEFLRGVDEALRYHELIKVKFDEFREEKRTLAPALAEKTSSHLVWLIGHVAVLYREKAAPQAERKTPDSAGDLPGP